MDRQLEWSLGANRATFEPPDTLCMEFRGSCDVECVRWSVGLYRDLGSFNPIYLLADLANSRHTPEARKHLVEHIRPEWFHGVVYIGASAEQRAVSTGFMLAVMKKSKLLYPLHYADTLPEARAWVQAQRVKRKQGP